MAMLNVPCFVKRRKTEKSLSLRKAEEFACPDISTTCISSYGELLAFILYTLERTVRSRIRELLLLGVCQ